MSRFSQAISARPCAAAWLLLALLPVPCLAAAASGDAATATVRDALQKATAVSSTERTRDDQLEALRALARELVDTRAMGQRALGGTFDSCTAGQQEEFLRLFDELIVRAYLQKLLLFRDPKFRFRPQEQRGDAVMVFSQVAMGKDTYEVSYEMRQEKEQWLATDIVVEGVSLSSNYADQFSSLLKTRPFDDLLDLMRRKVEHFRSPEAK
ncbi:MAG: MlaC/ttg2D family ABC transporter substrate-binding protein [Candidatus Binatia bacterium]